MKHSKHTEIAHCSSCGGRFKRGTREQWKLLCLSCYAWGRAYKAHDEQRRWLQRAR